MNGYLLLRDNKQSGPYSFEEITAKGFKPYDLIWAEGKSAGWRYPGELPEFSSYAPMVEEQPFDRFFKKTSSPAKNSTTTSTVSGENKQAGKNILITEQPVATAFASDQNITKENIREGKTTFVAEQSLQDTLQAATDTSNSNNEDKYTVDTIIPEQPTAKIIAIQPRKIFVTLPGSAVSETQKPGIPATKPLHTEETIAHVPVIHDKINTPEKEMPVIAEKNSIPVTKQSAYSSFQPAPSFMQDRLQPQSPEEKLFIPVKKNSARSFITGAVAACLLLGGVIIGLLISNSKQSTEKKQLSALVKQIQQREAEKKQVLDQPVNITPQGPVSNPPQQLLPDKEIVQKEKEQNTRSVPTVAKQTTPSANKNDESTIVSVVQKDKVTEPSGATNQKGTVDNKKEPVPESARQNIYSLVFVEGSAYKTGILGGISNLQLTISNNSLYPIDQVEVLVNYMNIEKRIVRKETVIITDIAAGEQKTIPVPKSKRGVSVSYSIVKINSRALGLAQSGL